MDHEYLIVIAHHDGTRWRAHFVNGVDLYTPRSRPDLVDYMNDLEKKGWELVSVSKEEVIYFKIVYKRPIAQAET
jgi:hypothetical protein